MTDSFRAGLALAAALVLSFSIASWSFLHAKKFEQTIQVTGSAKKRIKSDVMIWQASVTAESSSLPDAYERLARDVAKTQHFWRPTAFQRTRSLFPLSPPRRFVRARPIATQPIRLPARSAGTT